MKSILEKNKNERIGTVGYNKYGSQMIVINYRESNDITVRFSKHKNIQNTSWNNFKKGNVSNPFDVKVVGVGFIGEGDYDSNDKFIYQRWTAMLNRVYSDNNSKSSYQNCSVDEEWFNYQNFAKWLDYNYREFENESSHLDKDILIPKNRTYSKKNCTVVPESINMFFAQLENHKNISYKKKIKEKAKKLAIKYEGLIDERVYKILKNFKIDQYI